MHIANSATLRRIVPIPLILVVCLFSGEALAQSKLTENTKRLDPGSEPVNAKIEDIAWLKGLWRGKGLDGKVEEMWSPPMAGGLVGTFRLVKDDKLVFSEFFVLEQAGESLTLKLKHFDAKFHGWESRTKFVEFKLIKVEGQTAWFNGLTYRLNDDGSLHAFVAIKQRDGSMREGVFKYKRVRDK